MFDRHSFLVKAIEQQNMELDRFEENGVRFIQLFAPCPTCCGEKGTSVSAHLWLHTACGGDLYIGDNGKIRCKKCGESQQINKWEYGCSHCNRLPEGEMRIREDGTIMNLQDVLGISGFVMTYVGLPWLQTFMGNIEHEYSNENL